MRLKKAAQEIIIKGPKAILLALSKSGDVPVIVDTDMLEHVRGKRWYVLRRDSVVATYPPQTLLWRSLMDCQDRSKTVLHINNDRLDFRVSNLRIIEYVRGAPPSAFYLPMDGFDIGPFDTEEDAMQARLTLLERING